MFFMTKVFLPTKLTVKIIKNTNLHLFYSQILFNCLVVRLGPRPAELKASVICCHALFFNSNWEKSIFLLRISLLSYMRSRRRILSLSIIYADLGLAIALKMAPAWVENVNKTSHTATNPWALQWMNTTWLPTAAPQNFG